MIVAAGGWFDVTVSVASLLVGGAGGVRHEGAEARAVVGGRRGRERVARAVAPAMSTPFRCHWYAQRRRAAGARRVNVAELPDGDRPARGLGRDASGAWLAV